MTTKTPAICAKDELIVREFLSNKRWGTISYMEGSDIYEELDLAYRAFNRIMEIINAARPN
jgi:hypothetical protein